MSSKRPLDFPKLNCDLHCILFSPLILSLLSLPLTQSPTSVCPSVSLSYTHIRRWGHVFLISMLYSQNMFCICYLISISSNPLQRASYPHVKYKTQKKWEVHQLQMELTLELKFIWLHVPAIHANMLIWYSRYMLSFPTLTVPNLRCIRITRSGNLLARFGIYSPS